MSIPDDDRGRFDLIIGCIRNNKADELDNIINIINSNKPKKQYKGVFKNLFSAKFQHINWRYNDYIYCVKCNIGNTDVISVLAKHNLLQETLLDGSVFITACKENHYKTIDYILNMPKYGYDMISYNHYHCVYVVYDRGYKESFNVILSHLAKLKTKDDTPEMHRFLNSDRNAKCLEHMLIRDDLDMFKIYCKYININNNIELSLPHYEFYNYGSIKCTWYLIKMIKKYKTIISFGKNGYYFSRQYNPKRENLKMIVKMLDCILLTNYLKRTVHI